MKTNKFSALQLNKKAIASLNSSQLRSVGGKAAQPVADGCTDGGYSCSSPSASLIVKP